MLISSEAYIYIGTFRDYRKASRIDELSRVGLQANGSSKWKATRYGVEDIVRSYYENSRLLV